MSDPFIAEIKMFAANFAPVGWAMCDGQLLSISQNSALFSLVGTYYGGDGRTTFGLPDMRGRSPMHWGNGPGLSTRSISQEGGAETVALTSSTMANHSHTASVKMNSDEGESHDPTSRYWAGTEEPTSPYSATSTPTVGMASDAVTLGSAGSGVAHENMHPFLCVSFIIALVGLYPSRS